MDTLDDSTSYLIVYNYTREIEEHHEVIKAPKWALVFTATCGFIISIVGCLGNLLTIFALPYSRKLRNAATWFVMNLALTEMVFCITILPISAVHLIYLIHHDNPIFSINSCKVFVFLRFVVIMTEVFDIAAIAVNRVILIAHPRKYHSIFNKVNTLAIILGIWIGSILIMSLPLFSMWGSFDYNSFTCECDFSEDSYIVQKVYLLFGLILPSVLIVASYSYIFYKASRSAARLKSRADPSDTPQKPATGLRNRDIRIAKVIAVIFLVFLVCCTPVSIAHYYGSMGQIPTLLLLLHPLYWLQYCLNIFLYVIINKQYREAYISYVAAWWPRFKAISDKCYKYNEDEASVTEKHSIHRRVEQQKSNKLEDINDPKILEQQKQIQQTTGTAASVTSEKAGNYQTGTCNPGFSGKVEFSNIGGTSSEEDDPEQFSHDPLPSNENREGNVIKLNQLRRELRENLNKSSNVPDKKGDSQHTKKKNNKQNKESSKKTRFEKLGLRKTFSLSTSGTS